MIATQTASTDLLQNRNRTIAKSFFRELRAQGFSHDQIIQLAGTLLDLVTEEMTEPRATVS